MFQTAEVEKSFIGSIILKPEIYFELCDTIQPFMFIHQQLVAEVLWDHIKKSGELIKINFAKEVQEKTGIPASEVLQLSNNANTLEVEHYAKIISDTYITNQEIELHQLALNDLISGEPYRDVITATEAKREKLSDFTEKKDEARVKQIQAAIDNIIFAMESDGGLTGIDTGFFDLNRLTGGWQRTDQIIIAGRPAMGKTSMACNYLLTASQTGIPVLYFTIEMSKTQILQKINSILSGISVEDMRTGNLSDEDFKIVHSYFEQMYEMPFFIESGISNFEKIRDKIRLYKRKYGIQVVFIDYIQMLSLSSRKKGQNRNSEIEIMSRGFKSVAGEDDCNLTLIVLSQLNRSVETRGGSKRPSMSDLRDSGSLEQDADMIHLLYRPEYYGILEDEEGSSLRGITEIIIAKNRHGRITTLKKKFDIKYSRFKDLEEDFGQEPLPSLSDNLITKRNDTDGVPF